jgi:hypothetical protein
MTGKTRADRRFVENAPPVQRGRDEQIVDDVLRAGERHLVREHQIGAVPQRGLEQRRRFGCGRVDQDGCS